MIKRVCWTKKLLIFSLFSLIILACLSLVSAVPEITNINTNIQNISDTNVGLNAFYINVTYNETMDTSIIPIITFAVENPTNTIISNLVNWEGNTFQAYYDIVDFNEEILTGIGINVSGGKNILGDNQDPAFNFLDNLFNIDTKNPLPVIINISSNNTLNSSAAKVGDLITLYFETDENIQSPIITINGALSSVVQLENAQKWKATRTMTSGDLEGQISFIVNFKDLAGNLGTQIISTTDSSKVIFDKTIPNLIIEEFTPVNISPKNLDGIYDKIAINVQFNEYIRTIIYVVNNLGNFIKEIYNPNYNVQNPQAEDWNGTDASGNFVADGTYTIKVNMTDLAGNFASSIVGNISIDNTAPNITLFPAYTTDGIINNNDNVVINATITDGAGVLSIILEENSTGSWTNHTLTSSNNFYNYTIPEINLDNQERVSWKYYAVDNLGNKINSAVNNFKVENRIPVFNSSYGTIQNFTWIEDSVPKTINLAPYFYDIDLDDLNYVATIVSNPGPTSNPLGGAITVNIDNNTGIANISSTKDWNGQGTIIIKALDFVGASASSNIIYINVEPDENEIPILTTSISPINFSEDNSISFNILCDPVDGGQTCINYRYDPTYIDYNSNLSVNVNPTNGNIILTPAQDWNGITYVKFLADDSGTGIPPMQTGSLVAKINITPVNDNPLLNVPDQNVNEDGSAFTINLATYTIDVDNLIPSEISWKLISQSNPSLISCSITGSNLNCLAPLLNQVGYSNLIIEVKDSVGGTGNQLVKINVNDINDVPVINSLLPLTHSTQEDSPLSISLKNYESDIDSYDVDSNLTWSVSGVDANLFTASINSATDILIISPVSNKFGTDSFTLTLTDSKGATDSETITLNVVSVNDLPVLDLIPSLTATIGRLFSYQVNASDIDSTALTFSDNSPLVNISTSGLISFTPILSNYGNYLINISVNDGQGGTDSQIVTLFVDFDKTPIITSYSPTSNPSIKVGTSQEFTIVAQDVDTPVLNYQWEVNGISQGTNDDSYTYTPATPGIYEIEVIVSDGTNSASRMWNLTASNYPITTEFNGDETTNLSQISDLSNVQNLILENSYGKIQFLSSVDLTNAWDLNNNIEIANGIIAINSQLYTSLNKPAKITLYGLTYNSIPRVYYTNGFTTTPSEITQECSSTKCTLLNYTDFSTTNGEATFNVSGFSSFLIKGSGMIYDLDKLDIDKCENGIQGNVILEIKDPNEDDSFGPGEEIKVKVKVSNENNEDEKYLVEGILFNVDEDNEEEKENSDSQEIEAGDSENFEFSIIVPDDFKEENNYFLFIKAYQKGSEETQCNYEILDLSLEREEHKLIVEEITTSPQIAYPTGRLDMEIKVKNIGSSEEENVYLKITNSQLNISEKSEYFDLEEYGEDDEIIIPQSFLIPYGALEGEYPFKVEIFFDKESNFTTKTISVMNKTYTAIPQEDTIYLSSAIIIPTTTTTSSVTGEIIHAENIEEEENLLEVNLLAKEEQISSEKKVVTNINDNLRYILITLIVGIIIFILSIIIFWKKKG